MSLPEGSFLLIFAWVFVVFLLWNLYHFSRAFRQPTFITLLALSGAGLVGGIALLHFQQQSSLPGNRVGVLIFPLVAASSETPGASPVHKIDAQSLAIAGMIGEHLSRTPSSPYYVIPTETIFAAANRDSLIYLEYVLRFAKHAQLKLIGFGTFETKPSQPANHHETWQADFRIFDFRKASRQTEIRLNLPERCNQAEDLVAEIARAILRLSPEEQDVALAAPAWQSRIEAGSLQSYYAARFALATEQTEAALSQARELLHSDTSQARFATLYLGARLAHLHRQTASPAGYGDSLRALLPLARRAATTDSLHSESARRLGEICIRLKMWNEAENALRQARRRDSTDSKVYLLLAQLHLSRLQPLGFQNELELYQRARLLNPIDIAAGLAEADYYWRENREKTAMAIWENLLQLNPNHIEVLINLGRIYIARNNEAKIFETYERLLKLAPDNAEAYYNLGIMYYYRKDFDKAIKFFERAIRINNHVEARLYLASIHENRGEMDLAIQYLRERIRLSRGNDDKYAAEARRQLYKILLARGEIPAHLRPDSLE
jgi:tetratricopeptide (TPR) repeat protein